MIKATSIFGTQTTKDLNTVCSKDGAKILALNSLNHKFSKKRPESHLVLQSKFKKQLQQSNKKYVQYKPKL